MKKRMIAMVVAFIMVLNLFGGMSAVYATEMSEQISFDQINRVGSYCYYEDEKLKAKMCLLDGDILLVEGEDYEISVAENLENTEEKEYVVTATGKGNYSGSLSVSHYSLHSVYETEEWRYIVDEDNNADIVSYLGDAAEVEVPSYIGEEGNEIYFSGMRAGVFSGVDNLTSINLGQHDISDSIIINCPQLSQLTINNDGNTDVIDIVVGDVAENFNITAPSDLYLYDEDYKTIDIQTYCSNNLYGYTDKYIYVKENGWTYRMNGDYVVILSYEGEETDVEVPSVMQYEGEKYEINEIYENAFSGLAKLETISLGDIDFSLPLCENCPAVTDIKSTRGYLWLDQAITDNPSKSITIHALEDAVWEYYDSESDADVTSTVNEYCTKYGYSYAVLEKEITYSDVNLSVQNEYTLMESYAVRLIGGTNATAILSGYSEEEGYVSIEPQKVTWESKNPEVLTIDTDGKITVNHVDKTTNVELLATVTLGNTEYQTFANITVLPRLVSNLQSIYFVTDTPVTMGSFKCWDYVSKEEIIDGETYTYYSLEQVDIPDTFTASYTSEDSSIVIVNEDGTIQAAENVEIGKGTNVTVTYTDGTNTYTTAIYVEVGEESELPFELPSTDGDAINIYSWNEEALVAINHFKQMYPQYADKINYYINSSNTHLAAVESALEEKGKEPDIVLWDVDTVGIGIDKEYTVSLGNIGFNDTWTTNVLPFAKASGSRNGDLKALSWYSCPGAFIYRADIAQEVFGTADPEAIQEKVADWDSFMETAQALKSAGYKIVSGEGDISHAVLYGKTEPWVKDGVVNVSDSLLSYLDLSKQLMDGEYTNNTQKWTEQWYTDMAGDVFAYFGPQWVMDYVINPGEHLGDYRICEGPTNYTWGGTYFTATNVGHNNDLIKLLLYSITCDENFMYRIARDKGDFMSNNNVNQRIMDEVDTESELLGGQDPYPIWMNVANNVPAVEVSKYDTDIAIIIGQAQDKLCYGEKEFATTAEAMDYFKSQMKSKYPELKFSDEVVVHNFSTEWTIDIPATCVEAGSKSYHCTDAGCTERKDVTTISATGNHDYDDGAVKSVATCVAQGQKIYTCKVCKGTKTEVVVATGVHTYDEGVFTKLPTCIEEGQKVYTCKVCKGTKTEVVVASGTHIYGDWKETKAPLCNKEGEKTRTCTTCSNQEKQKIPATGFVKGGEFDKGGNTYTIKTTKGKKGTVVYEGSDKKKKKVTVPKTVKISGKTYTVTEISDKAFKGDTKITSVTIQEGVTKIGKEAFSGCKNLKTITIKSTKLKSVGKNAIKGINKKATIKVPKKQYSKYKKLFKSSTGYKKTMKIKK